MNLTRLRNMVFEGDLSKDALWYLLRTGGECEYLDYKEQLSFQRDYDIACISKDVVAMKNVGGGYIVVGVRDKTWEPVGLSNAIGIDTKQLRDKVRKVTGLTLEVDIVEHEIYIDAQEAKRFAVIWVRASKTLNKRKAPSVCSVDFCVSEKWGVSSGDIYFRDSDQTIRVTDQGQLERLLYQLDSRHEEQDMAEENAKPSPFQVEEGLFRLLPPDYSVFIGRKDTEKAIIDAIDKDPRIWIVNLHGPGGVGKTALATHVAYHYYQEKSKAGAFEAILFLSAKERELNPTEGIRVMSPSLYSLENLLENILYLFHSPEYVGKSLEKQREMATEFLIAWKTLLILDNMETVTDGRILEFIRSLPQSFKGKVLLTSRRRTDNWEYPIKVEELSEAETKDFIKIREKELNLNKSLADFAPRIRQITGGLPLAIQWVLGRFKLLNDINAVLNVAVEPDSPLLEFSFGNLWQGLNEASQQALAVLSIFDSPPTKQEWRTAMDWPVDILDRAIAKLQDVTLVREEIDSLTGKMLYIALPITLTFSRNKLAQMGDLEKQARVRHQKRVESMALVAQETDRYVHLFKSFQADTDNKKKAIVLCEKAVSQESLGMEAAEEYYRQAFDLEPRSIYVLVKYGRFLVNIGRIGEGIDLLQEATRRSNKATLFFTYYNLALAYDESHKREDCLDALEKALDADPKNQHAKHAKHKYGVVLSLVGQRQKAIEIFDLLIKEELAEEYGPTNTLGYALKSKIITMQKNSDRQWVDYYSHAIELLRQYPDLHYQIRQLEELYYS